VRGNQFPRETKVSSGGVELFVRERGEGHPLLMVNGLGGNLEMWGELEERLAKVARTIVFDAPGTGRSSTPLRYQTMGDLSDVVWGAVDQLGYGRVDILGYSLGGVLSQQLARDGGHRVRRLALAATGCGWGSMPGSLPALSLMAMPLRYYSRVFYEQTNRLLSPADGGDGVDDRMEAQAEARLRHPPSLLGYTYQVWAGALFSSLPWLATVQTPTLVVTGGGDLLVPPANSVQLARLLPHGRLHVVGDEGHLFLFDPETRAADLLVDYFGARTLRSSKAWQTGTAVDDDEQVEDAFRRSAGAQPFRSMSGLFRRLVQQAA
jgi:pimeloyl-ACP methyl ester carboxylesterase